MRSVPMVKQFSSNSSDVRRRRLACLVVLVVGGRVWTVARGCFLAACFALTWGIPVPGTRKVVRLVPLAFLVMRMPWVLVLCPIPDLLRLTRKPPGSMFLPKQSPNFPCQVGLYSILSRKMEISIIFCDSVWKYAGNLKSS